MVTFPILERELRVAARGKWLFRARRLTALGAVILGSFLIITAGARNTNAGSTVFDIFIAIGFFVALVEGIRKTADCISEEKREGTIGLLFLTDLRPFDVIVGKFAAHSIRSFHALLAIFPIIAIALVLGGVTGGEVFRATLLLVNTLFWSLSIGIVASTFSREAGASLGVSMLVALIFAGAIPALQFFGPTPLAGATEWLNTFSPTVAWLNFREAAYTGAPGAFWRSLLGTHVFAWACVALATIALPRTWADTPDKASTAAINKPASARQRAWREAFRRRVLDQNPAAWLGLRQSRSRYPLTMWLIGIPALVVMAGSLVAPPEVGLGVMIGLNIVIRVAAGSRASLNMSEVRKNGALELVLSTPLTIVELVKGQRVAMEKIFTVPVAITLGWHVLYIVKVQLGGGQGSWAGAAWALYSMVMLVLDAYTATWVGMWMGLKNSRPTVASFKTMGIGVLIPGVLHFFCIPGILTDIVILQIAHDAVIYDFRKMLLAQSGATYVRPMIRAMPGEAPPMVR